MPKSSSGLFIDHFDPVTMTNTDRILGSVKDTTSTLGACPSWQLKSCKDHINDSSKSIIYQTLTHGTFAQPFKEVVIHPLHFFKKIITT